ncbi:sugar phosphate isomerase/epimerase [Mycobacterium simiae]|uniref:Sugar phosphate isomerase/epimerase n=1 Tax=Mycobacterium simiae TaxID=1784 RepID=A0A5B1BSA8_MYCSI|nr:sugar phosphate isomerase/epimerase family protein [Mycobacterium simiae]KAA1249949.1 sugar phosphate isomerase/epimerase [Mycobacterium simiae]
MRFGAWVTDIDDVTALARCGYDFCELSAEVLMPAQSDTDAAARLRRLSALPLVPEVFNRFFPPGASLYRDLDVVRAHARRVSARMERVGGQVAVLGSGPARDVPPGMDRDEALRRLGRAVAAIHEECDRNGVAVGLEPLNHTDGNILNTLQECREFRDSFGLDGVGITADLHHLELEHESLDEVLKVGPIIRHVQVAGGGRQSPTVPGYDYAGFAAALSKAGYDDRTAVECDHWDLDTQAAPALEFMRKSWRDAVTLKRSDELR